MGLAFSSTLLIFLNLLAWNFLAQYEATRTGQELLYNLRHVVSQMDHAAKEWITPNRYQKINAHVLSQLNIWGSPEAQKFIREIHQLIPDPEGIISIYTNCPQNNKADCYDDILFKGKVPVYRNNYNPRDRPWYNVTRLHNDWVVTSFMTTKQAISGFPTAWALGFDKHFNESPTQNDEGIWLAIGLPHPTQSILDVLYEKKAPSLKNFDFSLKTLTFPKASLEPSSPFPTTCTSITSLAGFGYEANVQCWLNKEPIQFSFQAGYKDPVYLIVAAILSLLILFGAYRFLSTLSRLKKQEARSRQNRRYEELLAKVQKFPNLDPHDLIPLDKEAYETFVKDKYGSFPKMASKTGLDLNNLYRVSRRAKNDPFVVFQYETVLEIVGSYNPQEREGIIQKLLFSSEHLKELLR